MATRLEYEFSADVVRVRELLLSQLGSEPNRSSLQRLGRRLDKATRGRWLADAVMHRLQVSTSRILVVDSVRTATQLTLLRRHVPSRLVHITASRSVREARFGERNTPGFADAASFGAAADDPTERDADILLPAADLVVDTTSKSISESYDAVLQGLDLIAG